MPYRCRGSAKARLELCCVAPNGLPQFARHAGAMTANPMNQDQNNAPTPPAADAAGRPLRAEGFLAQFRDGTARDAPSQRLEAALLDHARVLQTLRERLSAPSDEQRDMLERCDALLGRAAAAARGERLFVAWDCLQQIDQERVLALNDEERRAEMALVLAESRSKLSGWRQDAAEALAASARGEAPSVAVLQALLRNVHAAQQNRQHRMALIRQQLPALVLMLTLAVVFFAVWGLLGGFDWLARDDVEVTVGMILVSGVLMGFFGGLVSFAFNWLRVDLSARLPDLQAQRWLSFARPAIGAAVAVPIVLFVEAGLINLGQLSPALVLALCFLGGFTERWFVAQIERIVGRRG
jgi:hypothetical protein